MPVTLALAGSMFVQLCEYLRFAIPPLFRSLGLRTPTASLHPLSSSSPLLSTYCGWLTLELIEGRAVLSKIDAVRAAVRRPPT